MQIDLNIDVAPLTTFHISQSAAALAEFHNVAELQQLLASGALPRPLKPVGEGSNLLFTGPFPGTLLRSLDCSINFVVDKEGHISVEAGAGLSMDTLIEECCRRQLWGLENLSGIPGTVGASVVQNVGAYGVEAADVVTDALVMDSATGEIITLTADEMQFGYRHSMFKLPANRNRFIVLRVTYALTDTPSPRLSYRALADRFAGCDNLTPFDLRDAVIEMREAKLPSPCFIGSAGSFFKNPVVDMTVASELKAKYPDMPLYPTADGSQAKLSAAWLIDRAGLKGAAEGGAAVWHKQPLVIVNATGQATAADVVALEERIIATVAQKFGVTLSPEVEHL